MANPMVFEHGDEPIVSSTSAGRGVVVAKVLGQLILTVRLARTAARSSCGFIVERKTDRKRTLGPVMGGRNANSQWTREREGLED